MNADTDTKKPHELREQAYSLVANLLADDLEEGASGEKQSELKDLVAELTNRLESALTQVSDLEIEVEEEQNAKECAEMDGRTDGTNDGLAKALEIVQDVERGLISLTEARDRIQLEG